MNKTNAFIVIQELLSLNYKANVDDFRRIIPDVVKKNYSGYNGIGKFVDITVIFNFQTEGEVTIYTYDNRNQ